MQLTQPIRQALGNMAWLTVGQAFRIIVMGVASVVVMRMLGPVAVGQMAVALSIMAIALAVASLGLKPILMRDLVRHPHRAGRILTAAMGLYLLGSVALSIALGAWAILGSWDDAMIRTLLLIAILQLPFQFGQLLANWFHAQVKSSSVVHCQILADGISAALRMAVVLAGGSVVLVVWIVVLSQLFESCAIAVRLYQQWPIRSWVRVRVKTGSMGKRLKSRWKRIRDQGMVLLQDSWPYLISGLTVMLYMRIDQVMLGYWQGASETGQYAAAVLLAELPTFMVMAAVQSVLPAMVKMHRDHPDQYRHRIVQFSGIVMWISFALAGLGWFLGPWVLQMLYGSSFEASHRMFQVLVLGLPFIFLAVIELVWVLPHNLQHQRTVVLVFGAITNIGLNYLWIPKFGGIGAAYASITAYTIAACVPLVLFSRFRPMGQLVIRGVFLSKAS